MMNEHLLQAGRHSFHQRTGLRGVREFPPDWLEPKQVFIGFVAATGIELSGAHQVIYHLPTNRRSAIHPQPALESRFVRFRVYFPMQVFIGTCRLNSPLAVLPKGCEIFERLKHQAEDLGIATDPHLPWQPLLAELRSF